jgi:adenosine deaminase
MTDVQPVACGAWRDRAGRVCMRLSGAVLLAVAVSSPAPALAQATVPRLTDEEHTARYFDAVRDDPVRALIFLRAMPKGADLHSHLSGAIYAESYLEWAADAGLCIDTAMWTLAQPPCDAGAARPPASVALTSPVLRDPFIDALSVRNWHRGAATGHAQFFGSFERFRLVSHRTGDMLAEVSARAAAGNVSYLELMQTLDGNGGAAIARQVGWDDDFDRLREKLLQGGLRDTVVQARARLDEMEERRSAVLGCGGPSPDPGCDVVVRFLYQALRARPPEVVFAHLLVGFELAAADPRVVGLNLVQPEDHPIALRDYSLHMRMIRSLRAHYPGVRVALHAGELTGGLVPPEGLRFHIREAVEVAGADRIGHGVSVAWEDGADALLEEMARRGVLVEIALSSNEFILGVAGAEHPLSLYLRRGVPVALATDDEGVLRSELSLEFLKAARAHGVGYIALKSMARNSLEHAFLEGASLWQDAASRTPVAACAALDTPRCSDFVAGSQRARLQRQLEQAFAAFERQYARAAD